MSLKDIVRMLHIQWLRLHTVCAEQLRKEELCRVLIVAPHPDDEMIGCGGLIARLVAEGNAPQVVILTGGERSVQEEEDEVVKVHRHELTLRAAAILGLPEENIHCLSFLDGGVKPYPQPLPQGEGSDGISGGFSELQSLLETTDSIFVPHWGEGWPDHVNAAKLVKEILRSISNPLSLIPKSVYEYCVWMWYYNIWRLDWKDARILKLSKEEHARKLRAIDAYVRPTAPCGKPWSGILPKVFLWANQWNKELYFKEI